jgi:hypothetical protein
LTISLDRNFINICKLDNMTTTMTMAQGHTDSVFQSLDNERTKLRKAWKSLADKQKQLDKKKATIFQSNGASINPNDKLKLNVGGANFTVLRSTLTQFPHTNLAAIFSGRWERTLLRDKKNRYFLDLNPICFRKIVDFLHAVKLTPAGEPIPPMPSVPAEWGDSLARTLTFLKMRSLDIYPLAHGSNILLLSQLNLLCNWIMQTTSSKVVVPRLLYRASRDGWAAQNFHKFCDNQGALTFVVVRSAQGYVFGGFSDQPWTSSSGYKPSKNAFLFSMTNPTTSVQPVCFKVKEGENHETFAIYDHPNLGPSFGNNGADLQFQSNPNSTNSTYAVGSSFECPTGYFSHSIFTGNSNFLIQEMEVFLVLAISKDSSANSVSSTDWKEVNHQSFIHQWSGALDTERAVLANAFTELEAAETEFKEETEFISAICRPSEIVDLDLSGERASVKRSTIRLFKDSALAQQFNDKAWSQPRTSSPDGNDEDDGVLLEVNPSAFNKILDVLRLKVLAGDPNESIPVTVPNTDQLDFNRLVKYYFAGFEQNLACDLSKCASFADFAQIKTWIGRACDLQLLYSAAQDGWSTNDFHRCCDNRGPTVTLVRATNSRVFGGFVECSWNQNGNYAAGSGFLFSLKTPPTRFNIQNSSNSLYGAAGYGPTFGGGHDLFISDQSNSNSSSYSSLGHSYQNLGDPNHLAGARAFQVSELEVYLVKNV